MMIKIKPTFSPLQKLLIVSSFSVFKWKKTFQLLSSVSGLKSCRWCSGSDPVRWRTQNNDKKMKSVFESSWGLNWLRLLWLVCVVCVTDGVTVEPLFVPPPLHFSIPVSSSSSVIHRLWRIGTSRLVSTHFCLSSQPNPVRQKPFDLWVMSPVRVASGQEDTGSIMGPRKQLLGPKRMLKKLKKKKKFIPIFTNME